MKSAVSREGSICKGPGAGLIVRRRKGKFQSDKQHSAGRGVQIKARGVDKAIGRRVYDFIPKASGLENNHLPHFPGEEHSDR